MPVVCNEYILHVLSDGKLLVSMRHHYIGGGGVLSRIIILVIMSLFSYLPRRKIWAFRCVDCKVKGRKSVIMFNQICLLVTSTPSVPLIAFHNTTLKYSLCPIDLES